MVKIIEYVKFLGLWVILGYVLPKFVFPLLGILLFILSLKVVEIFPVLWNLYLSLGGFKYFIFDKTIFELLPLIFVGLMCSYLQVISLKMFINNKYFFRKWVIMSAFGTYFGRLFTAFTGKYQILKIYGFDDGSPDLDLKWKYESLIDLPTLSFIQGVVLSTDSCFTWWSGLLWFFVNTISSILSGMEGKPISYYLYPSLACVVLSGITMTGIYSFLIEIFTKNK